VRNDASYESDPELKRDCKGALTANMLEHYSPTRHQAAFSALVDLQLAASRSASLRDLHAVLAARLGSDDPAGVRSS